MKRVALAIALLAACGNGWLSPVPPKYVEVAKIHHASCGNCHTRVEPGERSRAEFEKALVRHHTRVKMSDEDWSLLIDYLAQTP